MKVTDKKGTATKVSKGNGKKNSKQLGIFFNQTRCDACYACAVACKDWHDVPAGPARWLRVKTIERGKYPNPFLAFNVSMCNHCVNAPCVEICPAEAISKRGEDGIVVVDREKCLGRDECGYPCSHECPAGNDVLGFVSLVREGKYAEAWRLIIENNPLPGVCGRVCSHPCETVCNRGQADEPVAIHAIERLAAEYIPTVPPFTIERKKQRVAVVGSGPAGLSCGYHLARRGYRVAVFEALPVAGGMLRVGIPEYRLPGDVLDREIALIEAMGVDIKTDMQLGKNLSLKELDEYDAVFLAVGAHTEKKLDIPGINLKDVIPGIDFLKEVKLKGEVKIGKKVVVLGGGNVAFDCARTAHRLGASEVHIVCPEGEEDILAEPAEIEQGQEEGITIHSSHLACRVLSEDGRVSGVECLGLRSMSFDQDGRLHFDAIEGSEKALPADTVILAIGQEPDLSFLPKDIEVKGGMISVDADGATSRPGYYAGGDAALTARRVAWAIGSGKRSAEAIDRVLKGLPVEKPVEKAGNGHKLLDTDFIEKKARVQIPVLPVKDRRQGFAEVEKGLGSEQAKAEAERCLICRGMCLVACPYDAPQFGAEDNPRMQKCDLCLDRYQKNQKTICVEACPVYALDVGPFEEMKDKYGDIRDAEGITYYPATDPSLIIKPRNRRDISISHPPAD